MKLKEREVGAFFGVLTMGGWLFGCFFGLILLSAIAHEDLGTWPLWAIVFVLSALVGYGHLRTAPRIPFKFNIVLSCALAFAGAASTTVIQPGLAAAKAAYDSSLALKKFRDRYARLAFPTATYIGGNPKTTTGGLEVSFRSGVSVPKMLAFYKSRVPKWIVTPVKGDWGTWELRPYKGSGQVIRIGESIDHPGKTEVILNL